MEQVDWLWFRCIWFTGSLPHNSPVLLTPQVVFPLQGVLKVNLSSWKKKKELLRHYLSFSVLKDMSPQSDIRELKCVAGGVAVCLPQRGVYSGLARDTTQRVCVSSWDGGMGCDSVPVIVEGQSKADTCVNRPVCVGARALVRLYTLWLCHWSSLASCSEIRGTDKDFIQPFLTHKHTKLCPCFASLTHLLSPRIGDSPP